MPVMISRLVLSLKEAADGAENETEASFTTMSFSTSFAARETDPDLDTSTYDRGLPLRARRRPANLDSDAE
jgi:hypothetical protein